MPAQVVDQACARRDQALAVVDEQPDVELDPRRAWRQAARPAFLDRSARDRDRVDHIGLAALTPRVACAGGQLRWDAHDPLAAGKQEPLECARDVAAVLERPHALAAESTRPPQQVLKRAALRAHREVRKHPSGRLIERRDRMRGLVCVRPNHDHALVPFSWG